MLNIKLGKFVPAYRNQIREKTISRFNYLDTSDVEAWRDLMCITKCARPAAILHDEEPLCIECASLQFEYDCAIGINPALVHVLSAPRIRD